MRLANVTKSVAAVVVLALAVPAMGCSSDASGETQPDPKAPSNDFAIEPGQVIAGAQAALNIVKMLRTFAKYGEFEVTNGEILEKINEVQASIDQLNGKVDAINNGQAQINANIFKSNAIAITSAVDTLFRHYISLRNNNGDLPTFYENLLEGIPDGYGTLNLGDLGTLATLGQEAIPYLATYQGGKGAGTAAIGLPGTPRAGSPPSARPLPTERSSPEAPDEPIRRITSPRRRHKETVDGGRDAVLVGARPVPSLEDHVAGLYRAARASESSQRRDACSEERPATTTPPSNAYPRERVLS